MCVRDLVVCVMLLLLSVDAVCVRLPKHVVLSQQLQLHLVSRKEPWFSTLPNTLTLRVASIV